MTSHRTTKDVYKTEVLDRLPTDIWMVRPCQVYQDEYKECVSWKGRFHQNYIHGDPFDCSHWKEDMDNCFKFRHANEPELAEKIIVNEKTRRRQRLLNARSNNVWEYRTEPPADWAKPLPDYLEKMKIPTMSDSSQSACVIL